VIYEGWREKVGVVLRWNRGSGSRSAQPPPLQVPVPVLCSLIVICNHMIPVFMSRFQTGRFAINHAFLQAPNHHSPVPSCSNAPRSLHFHNGPACMGSSTLRLCGRFPNWLSDHYTHGHCTKLPFEYPDRLF